MQSLFMTLLLDARQRCDRLLRAAGTLPGGVPAVAEKHFAGMLARLVRFRDVLEALIDDPDMPQPDLAKNIYIEYKRISEFIQVFEERTLLTVGRFNHADEMATRLLGRICAELGYPYDAPICSTLSAQYFWADAGMDIVFIPPCELSHLLGWADLYHELGHFLTHRERQTLMADLAKLVDDHFARAQREARRKNWPRGSVDSLEGFRRDWRRNWLVEFTCDAFATLCAGPAFGWCNVRLCSNSSEDILESSHTHPADEARTRLIDGVLRRQGFVSEADRIQSAWGSLVTLTGRRASSQFELAYPPALLAAVADYLIAQLPTLGIKRHTANCDPQRITSVLNDAWSRFMAAPAEYGSWEAERTAQLHNQLHESRQTSQTGAEVQSMRTL